MTLLLDTHTWIWAQETPEKFGRRAATLIQDTANGLFISAMAAMELARLVFLHRIQLAEPASAWVADSIRSLGAQSLDVTAHIAAEAYELPGKFHKDPIDRVLVATARLHNLTLVTADDLILRYPHVKTLRASA